jgi:plastocyanin
MRTTRRSHYARPLAALAAEALLWTLAACGGGGGGATSPTPPQQPGEPLPSATVSLRSATDAYGSTTNSFSPSSVRIVRGGTITWKNTSGVTHNVTFQAAAGAPENVPNHASGENTRKFSTAGTFSYRCTIHSGMSGSVAVE